MKSFDFVVIGGGSAGFNAARVAHGLGQSVAIIDGGRDLGGLCILRGCMPSKTLLYMTEVLHLAQKGADFGLKIPSARADMRAMHARKKRIIADFASYREEAMKSGKFTLIRSLARFRDPNTIELDDGTCVSGKRILLATGSRVSVPAVPGLAETPFWTSDDVLDLDFVPESVIVLGGGVVACELVQFLVRIGTKVTQIQRGPHLLRGFSPDAGKVVAEVLTREGVELHMGTQIEKVRKVKNGVEVTFTHHGKSVTRRAKHLFNALGREPNTEGLNLEAAGVKCAPNGQVAVNRYQQTSAPHIYAGGDLCGPHEIVHLAVAQGELAARHAAGVRKLKPVNYDHLVYVVFTSPPVAHLGVHETELRQRGHKFISASYPFNDHGKSILMDALDGYVKVWADAKSGKLLGAEIVGAEAGELIHILSAPLSMGATVFDLLKAPWYHPTLAEILTYPLEEIADKITESRK